MISPTTVFALQLVAALYALTSVVAQSGFVIPITAVPNTQGPLRQAIIGISFEFFTFPEYFNDYDMPLTRQCLANLAGVVGKYPPIRIGGTTQDRALYNPALRGPANYFVPSPKDAPQNVTYGSGFMFLAGQYAGDVTLGLNRKLNDLDSTIAAAKRAVSDIPTLTAIELGNEPEFYGSSSPIAGGKAWDQMPTPFLRLRGKWPSEMLLIVRPSSKRAYVFSLKISTGADKYVTSLGEHSYPQSACGGASTNLTNLMSHKSIVSYCAQYASESYAARSIDQLRNLRWWWDLTPALWIVDYNMQLIINGAQQVYFHAGTIGNCPYCWWGRDMAYAPYYGAYFSARVLAGASSLQALDDGKSAYAAYALYNDNGLPFKALLYNSDVYISGTRTSRTFTLSGITSASVSGLRFTGATANGLAENGSPPSIGGLKFSNTDCSRIGEETLETFAVSSGSVIVTLKASEMVLLFFK
ncbi:Phosphopantetheine attachment site-containing protein [Cladochytrium replicatum]|nr:Phosphopantetheine attachment site-containing protein [Cladochytrium replicatum]